MTDEKLNKLGLFNSSEKLTFCTVDLSVENTELTKVDLYNALEVDRYVKKITKVANANIAYGGYLEKRDIYKRSEYFHNQTDSTDERNIHLGVDFWIGANTEILAPYDGVIHSFANNTNHGDYGPTVILKHRVYEKIIYSLYGHLSLASLENKDVGQLINRGETIGWLGTSDVNGDYAPHLHFQLIKDIGNANGDYPGVCSTSKLDFYIDNCPDPISFNWT